MVENQVKFNRQVKTRPDTQWFTSDPMSRGGTEGPQGHGYNATVLIWNQTQCQVSGGRVLAHIPGTMGVEAKARIEERLGDEGVKVKEEVEGVSEEAVDGPGIVL